ncbi:MAG: 50S ribosomal protein L5 [Mollicutes bacterium]|nr:50S ribosomal protein L5 [Mollicutes bacterium]MDD7036461.1 50S ribosomal protein L5 [Mollicutes bacterium]MDD7613454.1 50S ribosomal protein L5 [Mollicutes bacterium]
MVSRLQKQYEEEVVPALRKEFGYSSVMECPKLVKIILNRRLGEAGHNEKSVEEAVNERAIIAGQHPVVTRAKKAIANFKLREGDAVGVKVTLRRTRRYDFLDKFVSIDLPRVRDFRGISKDSFDGRGNYSTGVKEQLIFPEIQYDKVTRTQGRDVVIVTTAKTDKEAYALLEKLGMPFKK